MHRYGRGRLSGQTFQHDSFKSEDRRRARKKRLRDQEKDHFRQLKEDQEKQAELLKNLAGANWELAQTMEQLKETQEKLIIQEKLASLGALTAGIAHEIKNPLNFVNNFAALTIDLADELNDEITKLSEKGDQETISYITELLGDLKQNAAKINEHGNRADGIVRSMLLHSSGNTGQWQMTDINALTAEFLNLAYHGMRAQSPSFNLTLVTDYDQNIGPVNAVSQDLGRVFLNLFNNACYAVHEKKKKLGDSYSPSLSVKTSGKGNMIEIRVRDNGPGIPQQVLEKIFNPFFTTKPPGEGTGLGLSISHEIIVREHKGDIRVESEDGEFTEFILTLPVS
ncbi:MAG: GHKL domain-containing protein [Acidobacteria bacterium]|nr:GHKL domain-containing protein [Acidobacteriota bacterium]